MNNLCCRSLIRIHIYIESASTFKEEAILHRHVSTVAQNLDLLGGVGEFLP